MQPPTLLKGWVCSSFFVSKHDQTLDIQNKMFIQKKFYGFVLWSSTMGSVAISQLPCLILSSGNFLYGASVHVLRVHMGFLLVFLVPLTS